MRDDTLWGGDLVSIPSDRPRPADPTATHEDDDVDAFFTDAGELLFGWTRTLTGQEEPSRAKRALEQAGQVSRPNWAELSHEQSE